MKPAALIIGAGPYGICLAQELAKKGFIIIIATIEEKDIEKFNSLGYYTIHTSNLHKDSCEKIYNKCRNIIDSNALELKYIIYTARFAFYERNQIDPPDFIKEEMKIVNSDSPLLLAKLFLDTGCRFVFTSSAATKGFYKSLKKPAEPIVGNKKVGTNGLKYYSYTKRIGEENLYNLFQLNNCLDLLTIIYITLMHETNFFKDIGVMNPKGKGLTAQEISNYVVNKLLSGKKRIYPGIEIKLLINFPIFIRRKILDSAEELPSLNKY